MFCSAALLVSGVAAAAQAPAASSSLPVGSPLTFVSDETVDPRVRAGSEFRAHLKDALTLNGTLLAPAGTPVRLVVTQRDTRDGETRYSIAFVRFSLPNIGDMPVRPLNPVVPAIAGGLEIPATTLGSVSEIAGKLRVAIPLPFRLSQDAPQGGYTPVPLRTATPVVARKPAARPSPSPSSPAVPQPSAS